MIRRIGVMHIGLVAATAVVVALAGGSGAGVVVGGAVMGGVFALLVFGMRGAVGSRARTVLVLHDGKLTLYASAGLALWVGGVAIDALAVGIGITCFVAAAVLAALQGRRPLEGAS